MIEIKRMVPSDWKDVSRIYQEGIDSGNATFEKQAPEYEVWNKAHTENCRFIVKYEGKTQGWAALSPVSGRCVYSGVAEVSIYLSANIQGKGIGKQLLGHLIESSEKEGFWTLQAGIFPENIPSINLHKSLGFREIGYKEKLGKLDGIWRDVTLLERRSKVVGLD